MLVGCVLLIACGERASEPAVQVEVELRTDAFDALYELRLDGEPLMFVSARRWIEGEDADELAERLEAAGDADPSTLPERARIVVQNDVWGVWARVRAFEASSAERERILRAAATLVRRLAIAPRGRRATFVQTVLPSSDGWRDLEPEIPVMSHERLFGLRRIFHVRESERPTLSRAIHSTLVAIDPEGRAYESDVVGDLEVLRFEGDELVEARLFELDREELRARQTLIEIDSAERVPSVGADDFLATFDPPAPLSTLPCARCHDDAQPMSLPSETLPLGRRNRALLDQLAPQLEALTR